MNILIFGATGMLGQGVLRECLLAGDVERIAIVGREPLPAVPTRVTQIIKSDLFDYADVERDLSGFDACFFCLGVSSGGMSEEAYTRITYDLTMAAAGTLAGLNPDMVFVYVSGAGTDSTESGRTMWARVKGKTENALQRLPFAAVYLFRPGRDPAAAWHQIEDALLPDLVQPDGACPAPFQAPSPRSHSHHRSDRQGDASGGKKRPGAGGA